MSALKKCPDAKRANGDRCQAPGCDHFCRNGSLNRNGRRKGNSRRVCSCCAKRVVGWDGEAKLSMLAKYQDSESALRAAEDVVLAKLAALGPRVKHRYAEHPKFGYGALASSVRTALVSR